MGQAAKATRENRTITVDFNDQSTYFQLLDDGKAFVEWLLLDSRVFLDQQLDERAQQRFAPFSNVVNKLKES